MAQGDIVSESETPTVLAGALEEPVAAATVGAPPAAADPQLQGAIHPPVEVGDQVEYCLAEGTSIGEWRPAFVVRTHVFGDVELLNLQVLTDGANDYLVCPLWVMSVACGDGPGRWRPWQARAS